MGSAGSAQVMEATVSAIRSQAIETCGLVQTGYNHSIFTV